MKRFAKSIIAAMVAGPVLMGCTQTHSLEEPKNEVDSFYGDNSEKGVHFNQESVPERVFSVEKDCAERSDFGAALNYRIDEPLNLTPNRASMSLQPHMLQANSLPLSIGDLVEVSIENGDGFNGRYVVSPSGTLSLPLITPVQASGLLPHDIADKLELALVRANIFQPETANVEIHVLNWAAVEVSVTGAVFQPGRVLINQRRPGSIMKERTEAFGDFTTKRLLSEAIRAASGIRPDAKLDQVILIRNGWRVDVDLTGILSGEPVVDYSLIAGDRVIVPSTGCFQSHLVRPSQITPKGFRVFMSNLIDSADSNSGAGVGRYSTNIPYGTRLLQAAVSANCIGGKEWTNAPRKIMLASKHPISGETQVVQRSVEQLMRSASREEINPYLMPNDAVACYDSDVTNLRSVANAITEIVAPFKLF